jgi:glucokinase
MTVLLAAEVGANKMAAALVDHEGRCARVLEAPTPLHEGSVVVMNALMSLLLQAQGGMEPAAVGLSLPGVIDPDSATVLEATDALPGWRGCDVRAALASSFAVPVHALNTTYCALLGEAWNGALKGAQRGALLCLGDGVEGAFLANGQLQGGAHHSAGQWGRAEVMHGGRRLALESLLSNRGLAWLHRELGGSSLRASDVFALQELDASAREALRQWVEQLSLFVRNLHWSLDPGVLLIGGEQLEARAVWWPQLLQALDDVPLQVLPLQLGERAGLIGAARHALNRLEQTHTEMDPRAWI